MDIFKATAEAESFIGDIFQHLPVGIAVSKIDDSSIVVLNDLFCNICGWPKEAITDIGVLLLKVFPDKLYRKSIITRIKDDIASGDINRMSWQGLNIATKAGETRFVNIKNIPRYDRNLMITTVVDVTEETMKSRALESTNDELKKIMDSSVDMIFSVDNDDIVVSVNAASERILGYKPEELIGKPLFDFLYLPDKERTLRMADAIKAGRKMPNIENHYVHKNGSIVPLHWSAVANRTEKIRYGIARDATEIKKSKEALANSERLYRSLFNNNPLPICIWDFESRRFIDCNEEMLQKYGYTREEFLQLTIYDIRPPEDVPLIEQAVRSEKTYETRHQQVWRHKRKTGEIMYMDVQGQLIDYNGRRASLAVAQDITDQRLAEKKLKELNSELESNIKKLVISNAELEQFAYVTSHDLQEPLRMITSFLTLLEKKYSGVLDDKGRRYIYFAADGAKRMRHFILDLLEFSKVGHTDANLEEVDFNNLVKEVLAIFRRNIEELKAVVRFENMPAFQTYKMPLRQVFQNLIGNSLKYHSPGRKPIISMSCEVTDVFYKFSIKDNGIGIAPEYFDKIFIIFQRLHNKEEYSGTGMGLSITKKIIESLGGKIWLESEEGKGTTFYFTVLKDQRV